MSKTGKFVISLDFELMWGVRDKRSIEDYGSNISGVWDVLPQILKLFNNHGIASSFATVGLIFFKNQNEVSEYIPNQLPGYDNKNLSPYHDLSHRLEDKYFFARKLVNLIKAYPRQEIACHTFSHYYCLEKGQNIYQFEDDLIAAIKIAKSNELELKSLVFPRNQFNNQYLDICRKHGIKAFRGNENIWFHKASNQDDEGLFKRAFRLLDSYINISGYNTYSLEEIAKSKPYNIPSSRFLRPFSKRLKIFERIRLKRILNSMTYAAKHGRIYHLWWHPHNFGVNQSENLNFLKKIIEHYSELNKKYSFESLNMQELSKVADHG